jgi:hypothetical protein
MNIQNEPMFDIASNLAAILLAHVPRLKHALMGWPDRKWLQVEGNLPGVFLVDVSETGTHFVSQHAVSSNIKNADGTGFVVYEKMRLKTLVQISLFTNTKADRDSLGWAIKQLLITNYRVPILDYARATPSPTGEALMLFFRSDVKGLEGEPNFYQRNLTFEVQSRVLDATPAHRVTEIDLGQAIDRSRPAQKTPLDKPSTSSTTTITETVAINGSLNSDITITD